MAVSGLPDPSRRCPKCGERTTYEIGAKGYLHLLGPCRNDIAEGNVWPEESE